MDATVYPQPLAMGVAAPPVGEPPDEELQAALREHRAALASNDQVWQRRTARRVAQLRERHEKRN